MQKTGTNIAILKEKVKGKYFLTFILTFFIMVQGFAQLYSIPDINLRNRLKRDYPVVMTGDQLNIGAASLLQGALSLSGSNISDASGLQYFTSISSLDLSNNNLSSLPDLSSYKNLFNLYAYNNQLTSLPDLSSHRFLMDLQVYLNKLSFLPDLSSNRNLIQLYCGDNNLQELPDISNLSNLEVVVIGNNPFNNLPDFSPLQKLKQLHVNKTNIDTIIGLDKLTNLEVLYAWGNNIRDLSTLDDNIKLKTFEVGDNELHKLPNLLNKPSLVLSTVNNNHLTFEDLLPLASHPNFIFFKYYPQNIVASDSVVVSEKSSYNFKVPFDQEVTSNSYEWFYKDKKIAGINSGTYLLKPVAVSDSGKYEVLITNPKLPGLTLSATFFLKVTACFTLPPLSFQILDEHCQRGTDIVFNTEPIKNVTLPLTFYVISDSKDTLKFYTSTLNNLLPGKNRLIVADSLQCSGELTFTVPRPTECPSVFSPNGDGIMDEFFINETGKITIYDKGRNVIKELTGPTEWNGTKDNGDLADTGIYAIVIDDKKIIQVSIIR